jgi:3-methyladenine DNA glycosylase AlkC
MKIKTLNRKGARRITERPSEVLVGLNQGKLASLNLVEALAINFYELLLTIAPEIGTESLPQALLPQQKQGVTQRMALAGEALLTTYGLEETRHRFKTHPSDTVRGWVCYAIAHEAGLSLTQRLTLIQPFADDTHFGVREWAWLAVRPQLLEQVETSIALLTSWASEPSENLRRFAIEGLRPRGVWCQQSDVLKASPELALPLLAPLRSDASRYVQDSVGNWLNDASKTQPAWVLTLCKQWLAESPTPETSYICKKAMRSLK